MRSLDPRQCDVRRLGRAYGAGLEAGVPKQTPVVGTDLVNDPLQRSCRRTTGTSGYPMKEHVVRVDQLLDALDPVRNGRVRRRPGRSSKSSSLVGGRSTLSTC
jgi:hypothetical protein